MATHSSILAWRSCWTEEPRGLPSLGLQRVGYDWVTNNKLTFIGNFRKFQKDFWILSMMWNTEIGDGFDSSVNYNAI